MKLRVIIADDELQARKRMTRLIEAIAGVEVVAICASAEEVITKLPLGADVLLLDISMPGIGGLELRRLLGDAGPAVIFVTAHREHALAAFDVGAADYVMKPVTGARLEQALGRVRARQVPAHASDRISVATRAGVVLLDPSTIIYVQFDGALVTIHGAVQSWISTSTLKELEAQLPPKFARVDRRHLLNLDEVTRLVPEPDGGYLAITRTGASVPVARQAARELRRRLGL
ncbi:MAG TPA: LytTR family DNA-binding domain-containing protein [Kofleriaceae bacterium]|nr:LytTR family DNA-binding domain-containing protein [Kofleriaceae bacterium]